MSETIYRQISDEEVEILKMNGCSSADWCKIKVTEGFNPRFVKNTSLQGHILIGDNGCDIKNKDGVIRKSGVYNAELINCSIGNNVYISNIGVYISNYVVEDNVYIENCGHITSSENATFGNGTFVNTVNENGGRKTPIYVGLSAQTAYLMAMYRHRTTTIQRLFDISRQYWSELTPSQGHIKTGSYISGCKSIIDMNIGPHTYICDATLLKNGWLDSTKASPIHIGTNVIAQDFICEEGTVIDSGATINKCFVGEGSRLENYFIAKDSLFFSNCEMGGGEASSIFAGPYSVSHHKATLLIAGYFLFFNAGSASNQSNHLFKAGPVHEGIHERGGKFASNAYIMQPAREGAFNMVIGRHTSHHNTEHFPYSILNEEDGKSFLIPAANLTSYAQTRDFDKWQERDNRLGKKQDIINFEEYNPYIGAKVLQAMEISEKLMAKDGVDTYIHQRTKIKASLLKRGYRLYQTLLDAILGHILEQSDRDNKDCTPESIWIDMAGMYAPKYVIENLLDDIDNGQITTYQEISNYLAEAHLNYSHYAYSWAVSAMQKKLGHYPTQTEISEQIERGKEAKYKLTAMRTEDLKRDCSGEIMMTGYGIDSIDSKELENDFKAVRSV